MPEEKLKGVKRSIQEELKRLEEQRRPADMFLDEELMLSLCAMTADMGREISVFIARNGNIEAITVGVEDRVDLPQLRNNRSERYISGIRCIHTHPNGSAMLSEVDLHSLKTMRLDAMAAIGVRSDGKPSGVMAAYVDVENDEVTVRCTDILNPRKLPQHALLEQILISEAALRSLPVLEEVTKQEKAVLIGLDRGESGASLDELEQLAETAGAITVHKEMQKRSKPETGTYLGAGKVSELALTVQACDADMVICDDELTGVQLKNLEEQLGVKIIDRTALILDIFAGRAKTKEGKLQVELAQMQYRLPRLIGMGHVLSRQAGGIGTRGPGESKLEIDRRRIHRRIFELREEIAELAQQREHRRSRARKNEVPVVALVGYTNAGKSTLLNQLSGSDVYVADQLFATLDPVMRRVELDDGTEIIVVDTVGFVSKLPHDLVDAFRSTLEEAVYADVLVHVVDGASEHMEKQMKVVDRVLAELGADAPRIVALNKCDLVAENAAGKEGLLRISAREGIGMDALKAEIVSLIAKQKTTVEWVIPYDKGGLLNRIHDAGQVLEQSYEGDGVHIRAVLEQTECERFLRELNK